MLPSVSTCARLRSYCERLDPKSCDQRDHLLYIKKNKMSAKMFFIQGYLLLYTTSAIRNGLFVAFYQHHYPLAHVLDLDVIAKGYFPSLATREIASFPLREILRQKHFSYKDICYYTRPPQIGMGSHLQVNGFWACIHVELAIWCITCRQEKLCKLQLWKNCWFYLSKTFFIQGYLLLYTTSANRNGLFVAFYQHHYPLAHVLDLDVIAKG